MSRTINGKLTGRAAVTDRYEITDKYVLDLESKLRVKLEVLALVERDFGTDSPVAVTIRQQADDLKSQIEIQRDIEWLDFRPEAEADMADYLDEKRTQEEARM